MAGGFPLGLDLCNGTSAGISSSTSVGTTVTNGTANTKGSYSPLVASTASDACWLTVVLNGVSPNTSYCNSIDVAIGAGGSEKIIASDLIVQNESKGIVASYSFP